MIVYISILLFRYICVVRTKFNQIFTNLFTMFSEKQNEISNTALYNIYIKYDIFYKKYDKRDTLDKKVICFRKFASLSHVFGM